MQGFLGMRLYMILGIHLRMLLEIGREFGSLGVWECRCLPMWESGRVGAIELTTSMAHGELYSMEALDAMASMVSMESNHSMESMIARSPWTPWAS